jgi:hypothetical protein
MSDPSASERFTLLDEHEWRVLGAARLETSTFVRIDSANYLALIVKPEDVRILVFPDRRTQELAHARSELKPYLERHPAPTVLTLADAAEL